MRGLKRFLVLAVSALTVIAAAEIWLRCQSPRDLGFRYRGGLFTPVRAFVPDSTINRLGFHDAEPIGKSPGVYRILLLGDSFVLAESVAVEKTVGQRLEHHLNRNGARVFDVVSIGANGWGQGQELEELCRTGPQLKPDLVLLLFMAFNDVRNNSPKLQKIGVRQFTRMNNFRPGRFRASREEMPALWFENSALNRFLSYRFAAHLARRNGDEIPVDCEVYSLEPQLTWKGAWRETERLLLAIEEASAAMGARCGIVSATTRHGVRGASEGLELLMHSYPLMRERSWDLDEPDRRMREITERNGTPFLALEPPFRELVAEEGAKLHWVVDGHWNARGNDEAGRLIANFTLETFLPRGVTGR
jgi:hypothetical protein